MSLLMRNDAVSTRYGGGFVQSIDGLAGGSEGGAPVDWFYYVNGVEAPQGAAATNVHAGDHIWWDRHDWSQTDDIPAVVGSFPEPFLNGVEGKRLPVRVECAAVEGYACRDGRPRGCAPLGVPAADRRDRRRRRSDDAARARRAVDASSGGDPARRRIAARARARAASTRASPPTARRSRCSTRTGARCARSAPARG